MLRSSVVAKRRVVLAVVAAVALLAWPVRAAAGDKLGTVAFATSCNGPAS